MENTTCGEDCCFVKQGFCKTDRECPFYCESIWQTDRGENTKLVRDCYPKRATMETNNLHYRMMVLQSVQEDLRNRLERIEISLSALISQSAEYLQEQKIKQRSNKEIPNDELRKQIE